MTEDTRRRAFLGGLLTGAGVLTLSGLARAEETVNTGTETGEAAADVLAPDAPFLMGEQIIGDPNAPVTVYEYVSLTCPHCASFHVNAWPIIKRDYVDTGRVKFIFREVYFDRVGLWAVMAARCGTTETYHAMIDQFLKSQRAWARDENPAEAIRRIARLNGIPEARLDACMGSKELAEGLVSTFQEQVTEHDVRSTPTFVINGEKHSGDMSAAAFARLLEQHL